MMITGKESSVDDSKGSTDFSSGSCSTSSKHHARDDGYHAKQCLEPLVELSRNHYFKGVYRILWILGAIAAGVIVASIVLLHRNQNSQSDSNKLSIRDDPTMVPTASAIDPGSNDLDVQELTTPTSSPTSDPTAAPSNLSSQTESGQIPTILPTYQMATEPSDSLSANFLTGSPTSLPTHSPTSSPTVIPSEMPTLLPTETPTRSPTHFPSEMPTYIPTKNPTQSPALEPTSTPTATTTELLSGPAALPSMPAQLLSYIPGNLTTLKLGLLLSQGLDVSLLATTGETVLYADGSRSIAKFHGQPDGGATFPDPRSDNPGGWIYVSNSEMPDAGDGGVGALTFDRNGMLLDYKMVLEGSSMNCGGGRSPWNTWISCEEIEFDGLIYQVDPTGQREAQVMTLGSGGGRWESFAFDVRDRMVPRFFATEDHNKGTVRRFTPAAENIDWDNPWDMLHGDGVVDYLMIFPNERNNGGTYTWTTDKDAAKNNARSFYPQTEGIDVFGSQMFFVCKRIKQLFTINLDDGTYWNRTTVSGLFDGKPDQMQRILDGQSQLLYFTEEGGVDAGIHARDQLGRYFTVLESPTYTDETTGLAFSPDGRFLYVAYQDNGLLFTVWRKDGLPFGAAHLDVKYHQVHWG